jgi:hypothetical protein
MTLDELVERARDLPGYLPLRAPLLLDLYVAIESRKYIESTIGVPGCLSAMLGLTINHLHARLLRCEERGGEQRIPA